MSSPKHSSAIACQATTIFTKGQPPGHDIIKRYTGKVDIARCVAVLKPYSSMVADVTIELTAAAHSLVILSIQTFIPQSLQILLNQSIHVLYPKIRL
jgi:hypothetical protein